MSLASAAIAVSFLPEIQRYCPDVKASSVVLGVDEAVDARALFVCPVQPEHSEEIQGKFEGRFADMRTAIMTLPTPEAQLVGRVSGNVCCCYLAKFPIFSHLFIPGVHNGNMEREMQILSCMWKSSEENIFRLCS